VDWPRPVPSSAGVVSGPLAPHRKVERLSKPAQAFVEWATGDDVPANLMDRS
jgi:hypothetical protein